MSLRGLVLFIVLFAGVALGHPKGFHKKLIITVTGTRISVLATMDVDSGPLVLPLRQPFDADRNGVIEKDELTKLKDKLVKLMTGPLKLALSGAPLPVQLRDSKVSLREDPRANDGPLSVVALLELEHPHAISDGMQLEITDTSPDNSPVAVQVFIENQEGKPTELELQPGVKTKVRLDGVR
ncbi:MAG: hypothetical protein U0228_25185 [Myxococcaceae bacterium]